jgi:hypothetical protein
VSLNLSLPRKYLLKLCCTLVRRVDTNNQLLDNFSWKAELKAELHVVLVHRLNSKMVGKSDNHRLLVAHISSHPAFGDCANHRGQNVRGGRVSPTASPPR